MYEKNVVGSYLIKDIYPAFGYADAAPAEAIPATGALGGAAAIGPVGRPVYEDRALAQWRSFSEILRERRQRREQQQHLHDEARPDTAGHPGAKPGANPGANPAATPAKPLRSYALQREAADSNHYQEEYEHDMVQIQTPADPMLLGIHHYLSIVQHPVPEQQIQIYESDAAAADEAERPLQVADVMSRKVACVLESTTVEQVASLCNRRGFSGVPVVDAQHSLIGIVTLTDILGRLLDHEAISTFANTGGEVLEQRALAILDEPVRSFMHTQVLTVTPETPVTEACRLMSQHGVRRLVVTRGQLIRGIFSARDAVDVLAGAQLHISRGKGL